MQSAKTGRDNLIFLAGVTLACLALLIPLAGNLWSRDPYQFFPFAWAAGILLWLQRLAIPPQENAQPNSTAVVLLGLGGVLLSAAVVLWSPWLGGLAYIFLLAGWSHFQQRSQSWNLSMPPLCLLLLTLPPPLGLDQTLLLKLKEIAVTLSSRYLDLNGLVHVRSGAVIELPRETLLVEEACSGINSFLSVLGAALFIVIMERRKWWHALLLFGFTGLMVIAANVGRICLGAILKVRHDINILEGSSHMWTSLVIFVVSVLSVWSFDRFMAFFSTRAVLVTSTSIASRAAPVPLASIPPQGYHLPPMPRLPRLVLLALVGMAGVAATVRGVFRWSDRNAGAPNIASLSVEKRVFTLPQEMTGWTQLALVPEEKQAPVLGIHSTIWNFVRNGVVVSVAIDYPFATYHDVTACYLSAGWTPASIEILEEFGAAKEPLTRLQFAKSSFTRATVLSANFTSDGKIVDPAAEAAKARAGQRFAGRFFGDKEEKAAPLQYRVQAMWTGLSPLLPDDLMAMEQLFDLVRKELAQQVQSPLPPK